MSVLRAIFSYNDCCLPAVYIFFQFPDAHIGICAASKQWVIPFDLRYFFIFVILP